MSTAIEIDAGAHQTLDSLFPVGAHADRGADAQPAALVFARVGILNFLFDVFDRDQTFELEALVHDQKLFDAMLVQQLFCSVEIDAGLHRHQVFLGHDLGYRTIVALFETQIAIGEDADQPAILCHRQPGDAISFMIS